MSTERWQRGVSLVVIASFLLTSCATLEDVAIPNPDQPSATPPVKVGDTVEVTTRDGAKNRFKVTAVEADALVGEDVRVAYADMQILRLEHGTAEKSGKTIAIVLGAFLVAGALVLASEGGGVP
jgi:hypothetical protein